MCRGVLGIVRGSVLAIAFFGASTSTANTVRIEYDLSGSSVRVNQIDVSNGIDGTVSGSALVVLEGVDFSGEVIDAPARGRLESLDLTFQLNTPLAPNPEARDIDARLVGPLTLTLLDRAQGTFDGMSIGLMQGSFAFNVSTHLDCVGTVCERLSQLDTGVTFPIVRNDALTNQPLQIGLTNLASGGMPFIDSVGMSVLDATLGPTIDWGVTFSIRGREVSRPFIPEPVESGLLLLGLLAVSSALAFGKHAA